MIAPALVHLTDRERPAFMFLGYAPKMSANLAM